ncbi:PTS fructose transporter subunit IIB [Celerinatantimonas diazotrophica]|uniref:protein-N(pi)-phosphohistidine--D-fructose phosphotransferase n=1 Tax=Celerinatantimonas diazotrophica TaxID=412034 RepID=A0A4R1KAH6_9GAMM|nr:PTS fructose transporter subunit IIB [Celerinatantimonas diazotrophica]TCK61498.1 PTS system IIB component (Fru family) [Celerinatantimonas diazotrophica]CAG9296961.1 PTS system mannose-specific EIIBCA component [Celerinatantimonas diazotrophica]
MNIVAITACTSGIAHTYIAKEKLIKAATSLGHNIYVETQGTIGVENELTKDSIANADIVIIAADIKISGKERFVGKRIVEVPTQLLIKSSKALINKLQEDLIPKV